MATTSLYAIGKSGNIVAEDRELKQLNLEESFETYRSYLFAIAYRMLGSVMDAEDIVQETYLRYEAASNEAVLSLKAYLTTILTRLCIDQLRLAYKQRETYLGPWLPEPILTANNPAPNVEEAAMMHESLSLAFLQILEQLQPVERAVFLLREVFDYDYADISSIVGRNEAACRQLFSRAKKHLADSRARFSVPPEVHERLLVGFLEAVQAGDQTSLMDLLTEDATLVADSGGKVSGAALHPVVGYRAIALFILGTKRRFPPPGYHIEVSEVNYQPAMIVRDAHRALAVLTVELEGQRVKTIRFMANPDKLTHL